MDAGARIRQEFQGSQGELSVFLQRVQLNAMTTLATMFQNPAVPDPKEAAEESVALLLQEAGGHCQDAGLKESERDQFLEAHRQAASSFRQALNGALDRGVSTGDRGALALSIAKSLHLPM